MATPRMGKPFTTKGESVISFRATSEWAKVLKSQMDTKFDPDGRYSIDLVGDPEAPDVKQFMAKIEEMVDAAYESASAGEGDAPLKALAIKKLNKAYPWKDHVARQKNDDGGYDEEETGNIVIKPAMKKVKTRKKGMDYIKIIGAGNKELPHDGLPEIGNGSIVKAKMWVMPYHMATTGAIGVSLNLQEVKIIKLEEYGSAGGGWDDDEEGIEMPTATTGGAPFDTDEDDNGDY